MNWFEDQVAVVTGGGRGIGYGIARGLAQRGAKVAILGRSSETLKAAAQRLRDEEGADVLPVTADVATTEDIDRSFDEIMAWHGRVDVLVNNAGIADEAEFLDMTREGWQRVIDVNLTAPVMMMQKAARLMAPGSSMVNIASVDAYAADGPFASYNAAKAGLIAVSMPAAVELAPRGIRVNCVSPGWVLTDMAVETVPPKMLEQMKTNFNRVPMRRMITEEEIAHAVCFLASPLASAITGTDLKVDAGLFANLYVLETLSEE